VQQTLNIQRTVCTTENTTESPSAISNTFHDMEKRNPNQSKSRRRRPEPTLATKRSSRILKVHTEVKANVPKPPCTCLTKLYAARMKVATHCWDKCLNIRKVHSDILQWQIAPASVCIFKTQVHLRLEQSFYETAD
jgi:hypothetical protein